MIRWVISINSNLIYTGTVSTTIYWEIFEVPYTGKIWRGKILVNLASDANSPNFSLPIVIKIVKVLKICHQNFSRHLSLNFTPPKFSHVR